MKGTLKKTIAVLIAICFTLEVFPTQIIVSAASPYTVGHGSSESPYQISTPEQLYAIRDNLSAYYVLTCDIDLTSATGANGEYYNNGAGWTPIGNTDSPSTCFSGHLDGNGHKIIGLHIDSSKKSKSVCRTVGLFRELVYGGTITNLSIVDANVKSDYIAGILVGDNYGTIQNCYTAGSIIVSDSMASAAGGLVGTNEYSGGAIYSSHNDATVKSVGTDTSVSSASAGGIAGNSSGAIVNCYNNGDVSSESGAADTTISMIYAGGITAAGSGTISRCYNIGNVSAISNYGEVTAAAGIAVLTNSLAACVNLGNVTATSQNASAIADGILTSCSNAVDSITFNQCENKGIITAAAGTFAKAAGIMNRNDSNVTISDCYNLGAINSSSSTNTAYAAGIVYDNEGTTQNTYNVGILTGDTVGGIIGKFMSGSATNCYFVNNTPNAVGVYTSGISTNVSGHSDNEMKIQSTYSGFDFSAIWTMLTQYPIFTGYFFKDVQGVWLSDSSATIEKNSTKALSANISPSNATITTIAWKSSNSSVATVDANGLVAAVSSGTANITATTRDGSYAASCSVTVTSPLNSISLNKSSTTIIKGETDTLAVVYNPSDTTDDRTVIWRTSNSSVATVSDGVVTAVGFGTATVTANVCGKPADCTVTVTTNKFFLHFDSQGGSKQDDVSVTYNQPVGTLPTSTKDGYTFGGWFTHADGQGTQYTSDTVFKQNNDATLFAKWTINSGNPDDRAKIYISGTSSSNGGSSATLKYSDIDGIGSGNLGISLGNITLNIPAAIVSVLTSDDRASSLTLDQELVSEESLNQVSSLLTTRNSVVTSFYLTLTKTYSNGTSTEIHQLGGKIRITVKLTDAQAAQITDPSTAKLYYYDSDNSKLDQIDAVFDMSSKTVSFYTDHFSTYVISTPVSTNTTETNPKTGEGFPIDFTMLALMGSATAALFKRKHCK